MEVSFFGQAEVPVEIVVEVLRWLPLADLVRAETVCRAWRHFLLPHTPRGSAAGEDSSLGDSLWRWAYEEEFGGPVAPSPPKPRHEKKKSDRKERVHGRKRSNWRAVGRYALRTFLRLSSGGVTQPLLTWLLACGHHKAVARMLRSAEQTRAIQRIFDCLDNGVHPKRRPQKIRHPLSIAIKSGSVELVELLTFSELKMKVRHDAPVAMGKSRSGSNIEQVSRLVGEVATRDLLQWANIRELFLSACRHEEVELARELMLRCLDAVSSMLAGIKLGLLTSNENAALLGACTEKRIRTFQFLVSELPLEVILEAVDARGMSALELVVRHGSLGMVRSLMEKGVRVDVASARTGNYPLHLACQRGDDGIAMAKLLLKAGAQVNVARAKTGTTPLHVACLAVVPSAKLIKLLLDHGASVTALDRDNRTPADCIVERAATSAHAAHQKGEAIKALAAAADGRLCLHNPNRVVRGVLSWMHKIWYGLGTYRDYFRNTERAQWVTHVLEMMCEHGLDLSSLSLTKTLLDWIALSPPDIFNCLLRLGLPIVLLQQRSFVKTLLDLCRRERNKLGHLETLLEKGLDPNAVNAIHLVCVGDVEVIDLLLKYGADINARADQVEHEFVWRAMFAPLDMAESWLHELQKRGLDFSKQPVPPASVGPWRNLTIAQRERMLQLLRKLRGEAQGTETEVGSES